MKEAIQQRLDQLKQEHEDGLRMKADWEAKLANLERTLLRIAGAIQVMEEILAEEE
jgi:hypothetical protein